MLQCRGGEGAKEGGREAVQAEGEREGGRESGSMRQSVAGAAALRGRGVGGGEEGRGETRLGPGQSTAWRCPSSHCSPPGWLLPQLGFVQAMRDGRDSPHPRVDPAGEDGPSVRVGSESLHCGGWQLGGTLCGGKACPGWWHGGRAGLEDL